MATARFDFARFWPAQPDNVAYSHSGALTAILVVLFHTPPLHLEGLTSSIVQNTAQISDSS
jgi:hypothetical protein